MLSFYFLQTNGGNAEGKVKNLPVPVFLRPLDEKDASMKVCPQAAPLHQKYLFKSNHLHINTSEQILIFEVSQ